MIQGFFTSLEKTPPNWLLYTGGYNNGCYILYVMLIYCFRNEFIFIFSFASYATRIARARKANLNQTVICAR